MPTNKDVLEREITGEDITVRLGDKNYPVAFPAFAVALYGQETRKLNCARGRASIDAGRPKLTLQETRELKSEYRKLAQKLTEPDNFSSMEEMVSIRSRLDEESGSGDSLFIIVNWWKIRSDDPERIVLALWAALHQEVDEGQWKAPFTLAQLNKLIDFSNVAEVCHKIAEALGRYMPRVKSDDNGRLPNAPGPGEPATEADEKTLATTAATK